jgi:hypothetical protein
MQKTEADFPLNPMQTFELLKLAQAYHDQAISCRNVGARMASFVILGATLEAMLIAVANLFCDEVRKTPVVSTRPVSPILN